MLPRLGDRGADVGAWLILLAAILGAVGLYLLVGGFAEHDWSWMAAGPGVIAGGVAIGFAGDRISRTSTRTIVGGGRRP